MSVLSKEMIKKVSLFAILLTLGCCAYFCWHGSASNDVVFEEYLLEVFSDTFGYTLVGAKPASLDDSWTRSLRRLFPKDVERANAFLTKVFAQSGVFIFREINGDLWLINKKSMSKQILKHQELRSFVYEKFGGEERFFDQIQHGDTNLFDLLDCRVELIAIALGYGRDNGKFYLRRIMLGEYLQKYPIVQAYPFDGFPFFDKVRGMGCLFCRYLEQVRPPSPPQGFPSLEDEWDWIMQNEWNLDEVSQPEPPYYLKLPSYISCKSPEAKKVHERFIRARDRLARMFAQGQPSEVISAVVSKERPS